MSGRSLCYVLALKRILAAAIGSVQTRGQAPNLRAGFMLVQVPPSGNARLFMICVCVPGSAVPGVFPAGGLVLVLSAVDLLGRSMGRLLESITGVVPV